MLYVFYLGERKDQEFGEINNIVELRLFVFDVYD